MRQRRTKGKIPEASREWSRDWMWRRCPPLPNGTATIAEHQLIQEKISRMSQDYEIARLRYPQVGWFKNEGRWPTRETSFAKKFATEASFSAANEAIQIHGACGYNDEYDVECYLRNSKGAMIYEGSSEIQTLIQTGYELGERVDKPLRCETPAYDKAFWQG